MPTPRETILSALITTLQTIPRGEVLSEQVPAARPFQALTRVRRTPDGGVRCRS